MSKKTFQFDAIGKNFKVNCSIPENEHSAKCPVVHIYRMGIDTKIIHPENDPSKISIKLAEVATTDNVKTMFDIGRCMCTNCQFNSSVGKKR